jgi:hypothetical protein
MSLKELKAECSKILERLDNIVREQQVVSADIISLMEPTLLVSTHANCYSGDSKHRARLEELAQTVQTTVDTLMCLDGAQGFEEAEEKVEEAQDAVKAVLEYIDEVIDKKIYFSFFLIFW